MPRTTHPARQLWIARFQRYRQSNFTVAEFCRRERVSIPNFYQWKKKLGSAGSVPAESTGFLPVQVIGHSATTTPTIRLPGGIVIELPCTLSREQLSDWITGCMDATSRASGEAQR